jgi:hypothetical protein
MIHVVILGSLCKEQEAMRPTVKNLFGQPYFHRRKYVRR